MSYLLEQSEMIPIYISLIVIGVAFWSNISYYLYMSVSNKEQKTFFNTHLIIAVSTLISFYPAVMFFATGKLGISTITAITPIFVAAFLIDYRTENGHQKIGTYLIQRIGAGLIIGTLSIAVLYFIETYANIKEIALINGISAVMVMLSVSVFLKYCEKQSDRTTVAEKLGV